MTLTLNAQSQLLFGAPGVTYTPLSIPQSSPVTQAAGGAFNPNAYSNMGTRQAAVPLRTTTNVPAPPPPAPPPQATPPAETPAVSQTQTALSQNYTAPGPDYAGGGSGLTGFTTEGTPPATVGKNTFGGTTSNAQWGSLVGNAAGALTGVPGLGIVGTGIGTAMDIRDAQRVNDVTMNVAPEYSWMAATLNNVLGPTISGWVGIDDKSVAATTQNAMGWGNIKGATAPANVDINMFNSQPYSVTQPAGAIAPSFGGYTGLGEAMDLDAAAQEFSVNFNPNYLAAFAGAAPTPADSYDSGILGTRSIDQGPGSINGYGAAVPGAFGNFPTFQSFADYLNTGVAPWDAPQPPASQAADGGSAPTSDPYASNGWTADNNWGSSDSGSGPTGGNDGGWGGGNGGSDPSGDGSSGGRE